MPGSVSSATASLVMHFSLSRAFEHSREYTVRANEEYALGESQRRAITSTSRKVWRLSKRLTPDEYDDLLAFYESVGGPMVPFYFYDGSERTPLWSWDETGASTTGGGPGGRAAGEHSERRAAAGAGSGSESGADGMTHRPAPFPAPQRHEVALLGHARKGPGRVRAR